jgi:Phosphotransferase enzyme family
VVHHNDDMGEQQLDGGIANAGGVVRAGGHVLRPSNAYSRSIHAFLRAVRDTGFHGASLPIGIDADGRERLLFIEGDVPVPPYPAWSQSDTALASIAMLLRGLHDASRGFDPGELRWNLELADPTGGTIVCHNDVCLENVVFRDALAVGLLDFDFAAPGRPVFDVAQFARLCVPVDDDTNAARLGWHPADRPARLRLVADAYGLDPGRRGELLTALDDSIARGEQFVRRRVEAGDPNFVTMWHQMGGSQRFERRRRWWADHRDRFASRLL